jgi:hypothetical protein
MNMITQLHVKILSREKRADKQDHLPFFTYPILVAPVARYRQIACTYTCIQVYWNYSRPSSGNPLYRCNCVVPNMLLGT